MSAAKSPSSVQDATESLQQVLSRIVTRTASIKLVANKTSASIQSPLVDRIWLWVYLNKIPTCPIFYVLKRGYSPNAGNDGAETP